MGRAPPAHKLLLELARRALEGTPKVLGYSKYRKSHIYFFENLPPEYKLLENQLGASVIRPEIGRIIIKRAAGLFEELLLRRYIYTDFCAKNIILDYAHTNVEFIDLDSAWPITRLCIPDDLRPNGLEFKIYFWGLWNNYISWDVPKNVHIVPKTMVISFAAVWSRAIALAHHPAKGESQAALDLVKHPSIHKQRALWNALRDKNRHGFMDYFRLSDSSGGGVYNQWERMFNDFRGGRERPWEELNSATDNLLTAIEETQKPKPKPVRATFVLKPVGPDPAGQSGVRTGAVPQIPPLAPSKRYLSQPLVLTPSTASAVTVPTPKTTPPGSDKGDGHINAFARGFARGFKRFLKPPLPHRR